MRFIFLTLLTIFCSSSFAVDFTSLSRDEPVSTTYPATFKCYVDVALSLKLEQTKRPLYLTVTYIIGNDTMNDQITASDDLNIVLKQLFLDDTERLTVSVKLNNQDTEEVSGIEGSLRIVRNPDFKPTDDQGKTEFLSGVWKSDQTPLFRIVNKDSVPQFFRLKINFNEQFEFDRFFFKMKVISPSVGIQLLDKEIVVNEDRSVSSRARSFSLDMKEIDMEIPGTYYFQIIPNMSAGRVNGIGKVDYEIVRE